MIKDIIKSIGTFYKSKLYKISTGKHCYIGLNVNIVNHGTITLDDNVIIRPSTELYTHLRKKSILKFGNGTEIGRDSTISSFNKITFGKDVITGPHVYIADHNHEYKNPEIPISKLGVRCSQNDSVYIGDGCWLGTNVVIAGNINIGKHCVIGANSVVTKDIPDYCIAVGSPAKVVKKYNFESRKWEKVY